MYTVSLVKTTTANETEKPKKIPFVIDFISHDSSDDCRWTLESSKNLILSFSFIFSFLFRPHTEGRKIMAKSFSYKQTLTGTELGPSPRTKSHIKITSKKTTTKTKKKTPRISLRLDNKSE